MKTESTDPRVLTPFAHSPKVYLNTDAFAFVPENPTGIAIRPGTGGKTLFRGPATWVLDLNIAKNFPIRAISEDARLQIRWDMFNALNHVNYGGASTGMGVRRSDGTPSNRFFGLITGAGGMRSMQIGLRLEF